VSWVSCQVPWNSTKRLNVIRGKKEPTHMTIMWAVIAAVGYNYSPKIQWLLFTSLKMGTMGCPKTSLQNYHSTLRNIPEERRPHLHRGGSLKSGTLMTVHFTLWRNFTLWPSYNQHSILIRHILQSITWIILSYSYTLQLPVLHHTPPPPLSHTLHAGFGLVSICRVYHPHAHTFH
jgi:hypothetical protein